MQSALRIIEGWHHLASLAEDWSVVSPLCVLGERLVATVNVAQRAFLPPTRTPTVTAARARF